MRKEELWNLVQGSTYLTNGQMYDMIPLIKNNFWQWGTYRGRIMLEIADKLNITQGFANDIYDKVNYILNNAKAAGVREIYY
jgi:hypothetical protein